LNPQLHVSLKKYFHCKCIKL